MSVRRTMRSICGLALITALMTSAAQAESLHALCSGEGRINARSSPSIHGQIEGHLYLGDEVEVLETRTAGGRTWAKIDSFGMLETSTAWVCAEYLCPSEPQVVNWTGTISAPGRVAGRAGVDGKRVKWLQVGQTVDLAVWSPDWCITRDGLYVRSEYVDVTGYTP